MKITFLTCIKRVALGDIIGQEVARKIDRQKALQEVEVEGDIVEGAQQERDQKDQDQEIIDCRVDIEEAYLEGLA